MRRDDDDVRRDASVHSGRQRHQWRHPRVIRQRHRHHSTMYYYQRHVESVGRVLTCTVQICSTDKFLKLLLTLSGYRLKFWVDAEADPEGLVGGDEWCLAGKRSSEGSRPGSFPRKKWIPRRRVIFRLKWHVLVNSERFLIGRTIFISVPHSKLLGTCPPAPWFTPVCKIIPYTY